jgi:hypothetical protein
MTPTPPRDTTSTPESSLSRAVTAWLDAQGIHFPTNREKRTMARKNGKNETTSKVTEERTPIVRHLRCELSIEDVAERADRAAHLVSRRDSLEEEMKTDQKSRKSVIEQVEAEMRQASTEVRDRATYRDVPRVEVRDFKRGIVYVERNDIGTVVSERAMTAEERQAPLDFSKDLTTEDPAPAAESKPTRKGRKAAQANA